jgi:capsular polysaccharide biosynthesis protein
MKEKKIYIKEKKTNEKRKKKNLQVQMQQNFILNYFVLVPQPAILEMVPQMLFCSCLIKGEA